MEGKEESDFLTAEQLATKLNVSKKSITKWTLARRLPRVKMGKATRYYRPEIEKRIKNGSLLTEAK